LCWLGIAAIAHANALELQAHRGGRGLMPENTLHHSSTHWASVTTLELNIAITADCVPMILFEAQAAVGASVPIRDTWLIMAGLQ
jgi:glycerophosphoryl diester phosphodiesterase